MKMLAMFRIALRALYRNKVRSLLTTLGIIIGIAAVIAVIAVGQGASTMMKRQIASMGTNLIMIFPGSSRYGGFRGGLGTQQTLTVEDAEAILEQCDSVVAVSPVVRTGGQVVFRDSNWATSIQGVGLSYLDVRNWSVEEGDFFTEADLRSGARVCVVGRTVAEQLSPEESLVGETLRIRNMPFRVVGLLSRKGSAAFGQDQDDTILVPWTTARRVLERSRFNHVSQILVSLGSLAAMERARADITAVLRQRHRLLGDTEDDFTIRDMTELTETFTEVSRLMTVLLTVIASISLVVGGIGIMNIMLVAVRERTREIGLRMAVGARKRDILLQFLAEAVTLAAVGGILGITLGIVGAKAVGRINQWPVLISPSAVLLALTFSAAVGVFFGFYPAWRAARFNPIECLRYE